MIRSGAGPLNASAFQIEVLVLGLFVCALTMRVRRPSAGRDRAPKRPAEPRGRTAAPAKEPMAITVAIDQPRTEDARKDRKKLQMLQQAKMMASTVLIVVVSLSV